MIKNIFITRRIPQKAVDMLVAKGFAVDMNPGDDLLTRDQVIEFLKKKPYDAAITLLTDPIDDTVFDAAPSVKLYANYATGFDNIDLVEAKKRGIIVTNAPSDVASEAVAEHAIALSMALAARIVEADKFMREGKYKGWEPMNFIGLDVLGKTLGIVGAGRIGNRMAHYAKGLGMDILYTDIARNAALEKDCGATYCATIDELLPKADIVSVHVPLFDSTRHLINETRLKLMKPTAFLINTSRGPVVDEVALVNALKTGTIRGAGLDVFEFEPKLTPGLIELPSVVLTPHIASASVEARDDMAEIAANNVIDFFEGRTPRNNVTH